MSKHVDGQITVDTELSTKGFKAGSQDLKQAIKSLNTKMNALGPTFQKALSGNTKAMSDLNAKSSTLKGTIAGIEEKMRELANTKLPTDEYINLSKELGKVEKDLQRLNERQNKMQATGVKKSSQKWKGLQKDINYTTQKIADYRSQMQQMRNNGTAFKFGVDTTEFAQSAEGLKSLISDLEEKVRNLAETELPTDHYRELAAEVEKTKAKLLDYDDQQEKLKFLGINENSQRWKNLQYNISVAERKVQDYEQEMESMVDAKTAFKPGIATSEYTQLTSILAQAKSALRSMSLEEKAVEQSATPIPGLFERAKSYLSELKAEMRQAPPLTEQIHKGVSAISKALYKAAQVVSLPIVGLMLMPKVVQLGALAIRDTFTQIGTHIGNVVNAAKSKFMALGPAIRGAIADPIGTAKSLFNSLNQKAGSIVVAFRKIGSSLLSGTVNGLRQAVTNGAALARSLGGKALSGVRRLGGLIKSGLSNGLKKSAGLAKRFFSSMKKDSGSSGGAITKLGKKITGLGGMLKRMALRKIISSIFTGAKEGFNNLAQYSSGVNKNLSTLKSGLTLLKNSFATAFAPILNVVTPILSKLIGYLSQAATYVGKLFAALTGQKTFTKATAVQEDYAASLKDTSKASKEAKNQVASFDEANTLNDSSSSSDGNEGNASVSEMFEEVPIESSITDFMGRIKDAFKNGNFAEIGEILGNGINTASQKIHDFISWDNVGGTVTKAIKGVAEGFNSLIHTIKWENIGDTVAQGLNTVLNTLYLVITEFDWPAVAAAFARSLNGLVSGFDWSKLGTLISTGFITAVKFLRSAISTFDWMSLGKGFADAINAIDWVGAFSQLAGLLSDAIIGLLDLCIGFMEGIDWGKLGSDLWNSLVGIIKNIDWGALVAKAFRLLGNVIGASYSFVFGIAKSVWESLKSAFMDSVSYFMDYINDAGGNIMQGLWNGICDACKNVGKWIWDNIFVPFWDGIRNAFGIHSPSTKMAEIGGYLIEGLLNGITNIWNSITSFFGNALSSLGNSISEGWESIKNGASTAWSNVSSSISNAWNGIKSGVSSAVTNVKDSASNAWNTIKTNTSAVWSNVKGFIGDNLDAAKTNASNAWNNIKSTASTVGANISSSVSTAWTNVKGFITDNLNTAKTGASTVWDGIKSTVSTVGANISSSVSTAWTNVKGFVTNNLDAAKTNASNAWNNIKSTASTVGSNVATAANTAWGNIKNYVTNNLNAAKTNASNAWNSIKSTASSIGSNIKTNVSSAWSGVKGFISDNLNSAKSTASNAWNSIKSTVTSVGSNIKTNVSSAWSSVKGYVTNNLNNAKTGASNAWNSIKSTASSVGSSIKSSASSAWSSIKGYVTNNLNNAKSRASSVWSSIKSTASSNNSSIKSSVSSAWSNIKSTMTSKLTDISESVKSAFNKTKEAALTWGKDICQNISQGIKNGIDKVSDACTTVANKIKSFLGFSEPEDGPLSNFHTYMPDMIDLMTYGIKKNQSKAIGAVSNMASAISDEIQNGNYALNNAQMSGKVDGTLNSFSDKIVDGFDSLIDRLRAIAENVTFTMPQVATRGIVPYSVSTNSTIRGNTSQESSIDEVSITKMADKLAASLGEQLKLLNGQINLSVNLDSRKIESKVIELQNKRAFALNKGGAY